MKPEIGKGPRRPRTRLQMVFDIPHLRQ